MVGKTFKGLTDELLRWQTERFTELEIGEGDGRDGHVVYVQPGAGGRDRPRRRAGVDPLSGRCGAAVRPGPPLPRRQARTQADTIEHVQSLLR